MITRHDSHQTTSPISPPSSSRDSAPASAPPAWPTRAIERARAGSLDRRLLAGADPARSKLLAARAGRLTSPALRDAVAQALERHASGTTPDGGSRFRARPDRAAVLVGAEGMSALAQRLRSEEALYAPGVARLLRLVTDGAGPLFAGDPERLREELAVAAAELGGAPPSGVSDAAGRRLRLQRTGARSRHPRREGPRHGVDPPGFYGTSFMLPNGSWYHGRREG
jgi:hypothetical protein